MNKLLWLIPALLAADAVAAPIPIDAHEVFQLQLADGGLTGDTFLSFLLPLPGQDRALVYASELGLAPPDSIVIYSIVQLGGPEAGAVVQLAVDTPFVGLPTFAFRVHEDAGATNVWLRTDADELGRLEADRIDDDPNLDPAAPNLGAEWQTRSPESPRAGEAPAPPLPAVPDPASSSPPWPCSRSGGPAAREAGSRSSRAPRACPPGAPPRRRGGDGAAR
ncbi:MAG TPA: hypothetical protein VMH40_18920 [Myxococcaceae bacterium]|nr:hypothetical protein [Myxococcaceae bacterium]